MTKIVKCYGRYGDFTLVGFNKVEIAALINAAESLRIRNDLTDSQRYTVNHVQQLLLNGHFTTEKALDDFLEAYRSKFGPLMVRKKVDNGCAQVVEFEIGDSGAWPRKASDGRTKTELRAEYARSVLDAIQSQPQPATAHVATPAVVAEPDSFMTLYEHHYGVALQ
jgi:hypothetical protein